MMVSRIGLSFLASLAVAGLGMTPAIAQMKGMPASSMSHGSSAKSTQAKPVQKRAPHKHAGHSHAKHKGSTTAKTK